DEMPEDLRLVFVLFELEELSTRQIAELCEIPVGTAASRLRRAREDFEQRVARAEARRRFSGGE
ncbi:MAG TPA: sigma factor-like helix-turn-helix DNA-binding protein, partial [Polyangiaceae bacterium]